MSFSVVVFGYSLSSTLLFCPYVGPDQLLCSTHQKQQKVAEVCPHAVPLRPPAQVQKVKEQALIDVEVLRAQKGGRYS
jgi:hypothetical protein